MENAQTKNRIFPGFKPRAALVLIFALALLLGSLSLVFSEVTVFCGIAVFVLASLIFMTARDILPVCGILLPALLELMMTGSLTLPAVYIGFIFAFGGSAYLAIGRRGFVPVVVALLSYAAAAFVLDPAVAVIALIPIALGLLAALMLPRSELSMTVSAMTILLLSGGLIAFFMLGGDLAETADALREYIANIYKSLNEYAYIIEESTAEMLAAYLINLSPGILFAAASAVCYLACSLTVSFLRSSGLGGDIPENMQTLTLSPVSGVIFLLCFFLSAAFGIEGGEFELYAAVTENIIIALALPFTVVGCRAARSFLMNRIFASSLARRKVSAAAVALVFIFAPSIGFALFMSVGVANSLIPLYKYLFAKIKSISNKN